MSTKPLNILQFICPTGFYGAERWILAMAKHLPHDSARCDLAVTVESQTHKLEIVTKYQEQCGEAFELPMSHRFDYSVINKLVELIKQRNIDIIHTHGYKSDVLGVIAARKAGIKSVVTPHGFENSSDIKLRLFIWLGCKAMKFADVVAPLSKQLIDDVKKTGVKEKKIHYIQNGLDLSEVEDQRRLKNPYKEKSASKRIGFIGQLISRKNVFDILSIFSALADRHDAIELILVGDGEQRSELEKYASTLPHQENITFLGFRDDRLELLQSFELFVMTSTLEGVPRCLMEACAMGIPVAAYNIPGIDQLITHSETGLLAKPGDKGTLLNYWEELLFDPVTAEKLASNARKSVRRNYSAQRMANEYLELFHQLLND